MAKSRRISLECPICTKNYLAAGERNHCSTCTIKIRRYRVKMKAVELMGGKCSSCGWTGPQIGLDFHHLYGKDFNISASTCKAWKDIVEELKKCVLLCATCHRVEHTTKNSASIMEAASKVKADLSRSSAKPIVPIALDSEGFSASERAAQRARRRLTWPTKEELAAMLWTKPTSLLAVELGVSDKAISKWAAKLGVAKPPRGYWAKEYSKKKKKTDSS